MNQDYFTGVPHRLFESILFSDRDTTTKSLAWLFSRLLYGYRVDEISIKIVDLKFLGMDVENLPLSCTKINNTKWYEMDYSAENLTAKKNMPTQLYFDQVQECKPALLREIGFRRYEQCQKNKTK